jgi:phosphatidylserine/phosphatidylglycerophosphate/cardiolipin synthase-like enzyme
MFLIDGEESFREIGKAMKTAVGPQHFIYILGWWFDLTVPLGGANAYALLHSASHKGAEIRAMLWFSNAPPGQNLLEVALINDLPTGAAIYDSRHLTWGSHHQKIVIVYGSEGLIGFCGGLDMNPDRLASSIYCGGCPMHDVHCRITGPAANDLLKIFVERWMDHPDTRGLPTGAVLSLKYVPKSIYTGLNYYEKLKPYLPERLPEDMEVKTPFQLGRTTLRGETYPPTSKKGNQAVQIGRTYGNGSNHAGIGAVTDYVAAGANLIPVRKPTPYDRYSFAPNGEQTCAQMILRAIATAHRFIYIEDQYIYGLAARDALIAALPRVEHITMLVPSPDLTLVKGQNYRRKLFIDSLIKAGGPKVRVFNLRSKDGSHIYVHSKMVIVDDQFAVIGSANMCRRSYTHDSEVTAGITDMPNEDGCEYQFAHRLRIALWAEHLNMDTPDGYAELADGVASAVHWLDPPEGAHIERYNTDRGIEGVLARTDEAWDTTIDPDGS